MLNQIGRRLTESLDGSDGITRRHKLLLMLDEFAALGRLDFFESALAFIAGYGLRAYLIAQSLNQVERAYGQNNSILDNCHVRVVFSSNDERTAKRISDSLGTATEQRSQRNYAGHRLAPWLGHLMVSRQETARALRTPGEIMQLPNDDEIVMVSGQPPIQAKKLRYYQDRNFTRRILPPPVLATEGYADRPAARPDDWTGLPMPPLRDSLAGGASNDADGGGLYIRPELDVDVATAHPAPDVSVGLLDDEDDQALPVEPDRRLQRAARLAALDPADGIPL